MDDLGTSPKNGRPIHGGEGVHGCPEPDTSRVA